MGGRATARSWAALTAWIATAALAALAPLPASAGGSVPLEYAVKAVYLYKFGNFVDWPSSTFGSPASPLNLCVAGEDPFGADLDTAVAGRQIGDRPIIVRHLATVTRRSGCQILFVGGSNPQDLAQILDSVRGSHVLTVTDAPSDGPTASVIRFVVQDNHVRFMIDDNAASENGLAISSKLLSLALSVTPKK